jgi:hypothetical protein
MTVKELKVYKNDRTADLARDLSSFETNFILLSGGLLAFSISFIKDIVKIGQADLLFCLFLGWFFLAAGLGTMMFAWLYSSNTCHDLWKIADEYMTAQQLFIDETVLTDGQVTALKKSINDCFLPAKLKLKRMRGTAVSAFLVGLLSFSLFVGYNLIKENKQPDQSGPDKRTLIFGKDSLQINGSDTILILKYKTHG